MEFELVTTEFVLNNLNEFPLLDVRSSNEFDAGHIQGAINFPVLNNEERASVGTCYKQQGHDAAVILGYKLVGNKFHEYISSANKLFPQKKIMMHCWRGGLRSKIMANLLQTASFEIKILEGGYKSYRQHVLQTFEQQFKLKILGGYTGSKKTALLNEMKNNGKQTIDIEALANHRGSAFGNIGLPPQPTQEQFENNLAFEMYKLNLNQNIWIEDESRMTGILQTPTNLYDQMRNAEIYFLQIPFEQRMENILDEYAKYGIDLLIASTQKLKKRLGDLKTNQAISYLSNGNLSDWLKIVLAYYDKTYDYGLQQREKGKIVFIESLKDIK